MGARLRMAFNCCGSKDEEKLPRESLPQPAKESLGNTTSHVEHHPAAPARSNAKWFCGQPMAISQQAPAPAPAVRAPEPQEEVFHEVVRQEGWHSQQERGGQNARQVYVGQLPENLYQRF